MPTKINSLKIGLVLDDTLDKADGVQQYVLGIGEWLRSQGHDVHYLVGATKRQDIAGIHSLSQNIGVRFNGNRMSMPLPSSKLKLRQLLLDQHFDILHVQLPYSPYLAHRLIMEAKDTTGIVGTFHIVGESAVVKSATRVLGGWTKKSLLRFDEIVSVSDPARVFAEYTFGIQTKVVPNVIDYSRFRSAIPLPQFAPNVLTILFLGRLVPRKGCLLLLKAIDYLISVKEVPKFQVIICGKGPLQQKLEKYVNTHNLADLVTFVGYIDEAQKPRYYASADLAVFPSSGGESFGIVLLEAMASGHATVLAGDNVGYHSVLKTQLNLLFNPHSVQALADKLATYMIDNQLRSKAQIWGQRYAESFDVGIVGPKILCIYREALRNRLKQ